MAKKRKSKKVEAPRLSQHDEALGNYKKRSGKNYADKVARRQGNGEKEGISPLESE